MPKDKTDSHNRIIEAARKEFLEYGYNHASLRRIAANAGIQVSGLYKHFSNKEEMFESLVEPVIREFYELYHSIEDEYFEAVDEIQGDYSWEGEEETSCMMKFIYDHPQEFQLILTRSQGTKYEDFVHEVAKLEEEVTGQYMEELKRQGCNIKDVDPMEVHLLTSAYVEAVFQPMIHGLDREKAMHYAKTLQDFYKPAWKEFFGI
ncbi:MAG: TetR/AcrR family transcriptional regulator [Lachnospiraceae bacterium]|nr:TetR/AcrR family transcriptional regulator [Lachnospiraceae bacterium]